MNKQIVTVFGGTGFLGTEVVEILLRRGWAVRVASRHPKAAAIENVVPVKCDVRDASSLDSAVEGATAIVNAVSLYVERGQSTFEAIHVEGAAHVARCARNAGVSHLVHVSGIGANRRAKSRYVRARAHGEQRVRKAFPDATVVRPSVITSSDAGFVRSLELLSRLPVIPLFGSGNTRLQPVWVRDVAAGIAGVIGSKKARGRTYEFGGAAQYSYRQCLRLVLRKHRRRGILIPVPFALWRALAVVLERLPGALLTRDQVMLMQRDNVVDDSAHGFGDLFLTPASFESLLES